jgi:hypothetical protein
VLRDSYKNGFDSALSSLEKYSGGPGSGVKEHNTAPIDYPQSKYVSVGTRKAMLDNMYYRKEIVPMESITAVGQKNFVPKKLKKFLDNPEIIEGKPVDLLRVGDNDYHVIDGHHRVLAAAVMGKTEISARVRRKSKKTMKDS